MLLGADRPGTGEVEVSCEVFHGVTMTEPFRAEGGVEVPAGVTDCRTDAGLPWAGLRIAYLARCPARNGSGVFYKIMCQCAAWERLGARPELFLSVDRLDPGEVPQAFSRVHEYRYNSSAARALALTRAVRDVLSTQPELVYARYDLYHPAFEAMRGRLLALEVNTDDSIEYALDTRRRALFNRLTRNRMLGLAAGFAFVTRELAQSSSFPSLVPRVVVGNSADLASVVPVPPVFNDQPVVGMAGSLSQPWQGVDFILEAARLRPHWRFELVGRTGLADLPPNVKALSAVSRSELGEIFSRWDMGLGPLALERKGLHESSPLKVMDYLAHGLPVVLGGPVELPSTVRDYVTQVEAPASAASLVAAIERLWMATRAKRVPRSHVAGIDATVRERARLEFLASLAMAAPGARRLAS